MTTAPLPFLPLLSPSSSAPSHTPYLPVVREGSVRSLVPVTDGRGLRRALTRSNAPEGWGRHLLRAGYAWLSRARATGHGPWQLDPVELDDSLLRQHLGDVMGHDVRLAIHFGPPRANRKPVVHVLDDDGELIAVAKVGACPLTRELVRGEADALERLAAGGLPTWHFEVPTLLWVGDWAGSLMLVQSAVPCSGRHRLPDDDQRVAASRELSDRVGTPGHDAAAYVQDLRDRLTALAEPELVARCLGAVDDVERLLDPADVRTGAWHGDWSPQNMRRTSNGVAVWDWERFALGRPLGFDEAHFRLQQLLAGGRTQPGVNLLEHSDALFGPWQPRLDRRQAPGLAALLLLDLTARYVGDGQSRTTSPAAGVRDWVLPALHRLRHDLDHPGDSR